MNDDTNDNKQAASDAISLLTADHGKVKQLFQQFAVLRGETGQDDLKAELVGQICFALTVHTMIEEEIFYPAARAAIDNDDLMDEAEAEHASAKDLINQLEGMTPDDEQYDATVNMLSEQIEDHVSAEESDMFPKLKKAQLDIEALGLQIKERKEEIEAEFKDSPAPGKTGADIEAGRDKAGRGQAHS
ncbi:MAG TPA: hemerythrin domain-containing protein [Janthinobacterium sp.]|jgi:hemerythrin superfamily protein|nr:hemerythrin domain-containing protein [Janthinobacterium sp.]